MIHSFPSVFWACLHEEAGTESPDGSRLCSPRCRVGGCEGSLSPLLEGPHSVLLLLTKTAVAMCTGQNGLPADRQAPRCDSTFLHLCFFFFSFMFVYSVNQMTSDFDSGLWGKMCSWREAGGLEHLGGDVPGEVTGHMVVTEGEWTLADGFTEVMS